jgi:hypothetical protein
MFIHQIFVDEYNTPMEFIVDDVGKNFTLRICHVDVFNAPLTEYEMDMADDNVKAACSLLAVEFLQELVRNVVTDMAWRPEPTENNYNVPAVEVPKTVVVPEVPEVPVRVRTAKPWSAQENNTLMMMYYNGTPYSEIAKALNRTQTAVGNRINNYQASMNLTRRKNRSK